MAKRKRGINANDLTTAQAEADLKYGPEITTVRGLMDQAKTQYADDVNAAKTNAQATRSAAHAAMPQVKRIYSGAKSAADAAADDVGRAFGGLGAAADIFKAATAREQGGQTSRIAEAKANASQALVDRGTEATAGRALALNEARRSLNSNADTLSKRLSDITGESSASIVARLGSLRSERAERSKDKSIARTGADARAAEGKANRESREGIAEANRKAAAERAAAKAKQTGGTKRASAPRLEAISSAFERARRIADGLRKTGTAAERHAVAEKLVQGTVIAKGDTSGARAIPAFNQLVASAALDMAYDGHVSRANAAKLHALGYKVTDLPGAIDYTTYARNKPKAKPPATTTNSFSQSAGDMIRGR